MAYCLRPYCSARFCAARAANNVNQLEVAMDELNNVDVVDFDALSDRPESIVVGKVSEITGAAPSGRMDADDNVVWGNE